MVISDYLAKSRINIKGKLPYPSLLESKCTFVDCILLNDPRDIFFAHMETSPMLVEGCSLGIFSAH
jgi:hypothetical protein